MDIDHLFDCYLNYGPHFKLEDLYHCCEEVKFKRLSLVFHSYELLAIFWISIFVFSLDNIWKAIGIGATQHLLFDQVRNISVQKLDRWGYFLSFRLKNRFKKERIAKER